MLEKLHLYLKGFSPRITRISISIIATISRKCIKLPRILNPTKPKSHNTINTAAIVVSIDFVKITSRNCPLRRDALCN